MPKLPLKKNVPAKRTTRAKRATKKTKKTKKTGKGGGGGRSPRPTAKGRRTQKTPSADKLFPVIKPGDCGVLLLIRDAAGNTFDEAVGAVSTGAGGSGVKRAGRPSKAKSPRSRKAGTVGPEVCQALAAVGHPSRAKLLCKLLQGPATYRSLQQVTKLGAGPLYHHINHLRLAKLILPKQRDLYELTRGGRNLILSVMVLGSVIRDGRRRPVPTK